MSDISQLLKSTNVSLQKEAASQAASQFGAVVEDFARGKLGFDRGGSKDNIEPNRSKDDPFTWVSTSYAAALAGGAGYRPKLKFLFKVQFVFTEAAIASYPALANQDFTFMIQYVDRPKVEFEYDEDINQYNFRTKVLKKISHRELTVKFLDDTGNRVFDFFRTMMFLHSPITRRAVDRELTGDQPSSSSIEAQIIAGSGMAFTSALGLNGRSQNDTAHRGVINSGLGSIGGSIAAIRVKQMFMPSNVILNSNSESQLTPQEVIFDFLNPRIKSFDLDELSHDANDASVLTMVFDYDWMEMLKVGALPRDDSPKYNIVVPGAATASVDVSPLTGRGSSPAGNGNAFANIISGQLGRFAQQLTSTAVNRAVRAVAGGGLYGSTFSSILSPGVSSIAGGIVGSASRDLLNGSASSIKTGRPAANPPAASDRTGSGGVNNSIDSVSAQGVTWAGGAEDQPPF